MLSWPDEWGTPALCSGENLPIQKGAGWMGREDPGVTRARSSHIHPLGHGTGECGIRTMGEDRLWLWIPELSEGSGEFPVPGDVQTETVGILGFSDSDIFSFPLPSGPPSCVQTLILRLLSA